MSNRDKKGITSLLFGQDSCWTYLKAHNFRIADWKLKTESFFILAKTWFIQWLMSALSSNVFTSMSIQSIARTYAVYNSSESTNPKSENTQNSQLLLIWEVLFFLRLSVSLINALAAGCFIMKTYWVTENLVRHMDAMSKSYLTHEN